MKGGRKEMSETQRNERRKESGRKDGRKKKKEIKERKAFQTFIKAYIPDSIFRFRL